MNIVRGFQDVEISIERGYLMLRQGTNLVSVPAQFASCVVANIQDAAAPEAEPKTSSRFGRRAQVGK